MKLRAAADDSFAANVFDAPDVAQNCVQAQVAPSYCGECGSGLLLLEKAARLCQRNRRVLYRWVEEGRVHFCELAAGSVAICGQTLAAQMNELETTTAQLSGPTNAVRRSACSRHHNF